MKLENTPDRQQQKHQKLFLDGWTLLDLQNMVPPRHLRSFNKSSPRARFGHAVLAASRGDWQQALISFREEGSLLVAFNGSLFKIPGRKF